MNKFILFIFIFLFSFSLFSPVDAIDISALKIGGVTTGFGGRILVNIPCTCSGTSLLTILDVMTLKEIQLIYIPFLSRLNSFYMLWTPSNWTLGTYFGSSSVTSAYNSYLDEIGLDSAFDEFGNPAICYVGVWPFCESSGSPVGIITSFPFSGVGTSLTPLKVK